ncbi:MAG: glutathione S-transferase family protein, partial [Caulobacteraceae bacterium]|nr:glutathione S-transferase family protein [Caulobacteraceae bacterium]
YPDFLAKWPLGTFPVLVDSNRNRIITETSVIIEYLDQYYPGRVRFVPKDFDTALEVRRWDRLFDTIGTTMTKVVMDKVRPDDQHDPIGVEAAKVAVRKIYTVVEAQLGDRAFIVGDSLTLADASAAPSLWYGTRNIPLDGAFPRIAAYLERLKAWPPFARAVKGSEPLFHMYPGA